MVLVDLWKKLREGFMWLLGFMGPTLAFYLPYLTSPYIAQTGGYLEDRIGTGLNNNLGNFFHFHSFYSSFYYPSLLGLLWVGFMVWALGGFRWGQGWLSLGAMAVTVGLSLQSSWLGIWTGPLFALILSLVFISPRLTLAQRVVFLWFAVPFWGYNFIVETPLTHIYTSLPGWALLAGWIVDYALQAKPIQTKLGRWGLIGVNTCLLTLSTVYLWAVFLQPDRHFVRNYPQSNPPLFWSPYQTRPETGFFGFPYQAGWKGVGALISQNIIQSDYGSNQKEAITRWYTRQAPRACNEAEFYFLVINQAEPRPKPIDFKPDRYPRIGQINTDSATLTLHQLAPPTISLGQLNLSQLSTQFDATARPSAFSRPLIQLAGQSDQIVTEANFGGLLKLRGYDLDTNRATPGGRLRLMTYWEALAPISKDYKLFVHLDSDKKYAQADGVPRCHTYPTTLWQPGQIIFDHQSLLISPDTPLGDHPLIIGWYEQASSPQDSGHRLDILDVAGNPAGVSFRLTKVSIRPFQQKTTPD